MKLAQTIWFLAAATAGYKLYENKDKLIPEIKETKASLTRVQEHLNRIKENSRLIQDQLEQVQDLSQDLAYKSQLLQQEIKARTQAIQDIWK